MTAIGKETFRQYRKRLRVALGKQAPDVLFTGGEFLNVFTGEILREDIAVSDDRIAYLTHKEPHRTSAQTRVVDVSGKVLVPGYFDAHAHTDLFYTPWEFAKSVATTGTTAFFSDSHDMANGLGMEGFVSVLKVAGSFPTRFFSGVPLASPPYPVEGEDLYDAEKVKKLLRFSDIIRSGSELTPWVKVIREDEYLLRKLYNVRQATGRLEGHTIGARAEKLTVLVAAGLTSCHESITEEDVRERLRRGLYAMIRQGSIRGEFDVLYPFFQAYHPRIMLTPDGLFADEIAEKGYMDFVLKEAIARGADPAAVIRMVTLNPAVYFGLETHLGGLAPGRLADFNVLNDLRNPTPSQVWIGGRLVAREGKWMGSNLTPPVTAAAGRPFSISPLRAENFRARYPEEFSGGIPVIDVIDKTVTGIYNWLPHTGREGAADPGSDVMKIALIHREGPTAGMGIGYVRGFGLRGNTTIASSVAHETHNLMVMGADDGEMAQAINSVVKMGGGIVIRSGGQTIYRLPLPVGGMMSPLPMPDLARELLTLHHLLNEKGTLRQDPLWTFVFLSFTSILHLRITISGVYDVKKGIILYNARA